MHRLKRKSRKQTDEEVTNLVEHLAQQRLFEISNEADLESEFSKIEDQPKIRRPSPISRSTMLQSGDKRMRDSRFVTPLQSRNLTRRVNIINYSHTSMPSVKNYQIKDSKGDTVYVGSLKQQQYWFEPLKNFTKFVILDNRDSREDPKKPKDALPTPKINKGLYRNNLFRKTRDERIAECQTSSSVFQLPRPEDLTGSRYRPLKQVIHSIYSEYRNYSCENIQRRAVVKKS